MELKAIAGLLVLGILIAGCVEPGPGPSPQGFERADDSQATEAGVKELVSGSNQFAFDLYNNLKGEEQGNVFFSPWSIESALGMTYEGAKGQTAQEMEQVLHLPADDVKRQSSFARLYNLINEPDENFKLSTANSLWTQQDYEFLQQYFETVDNYYKGKVTNVDFETNAEGVRQTINKWVEEKTTGKIKDMIPPGVLNSLTRLVLANAVYFKGKWAIQFKEENTKKADFRTGNGTVQADMMSLGSAKFNYAETETMQALEMPYEGGKLSMLVLLPKEDNIETINGYLSEEKLSEIRTSMAEREVNVYFPKFKFETRYAMVPTFRGMEMTTIFSGSADLSGMGGKPGDLYVSDIIHQAFVEVNEEGTEAAAATVVVVGATAMPGPEIEFKADHPFIFLIQENETGNILFFGLAKDPTAK